jgi:hypothetical protein
MNEEMRTYLVGRRNSTVSCDIALPASETSVSRKHLELTVTESGRCYIVHVHPKNTTRVSRNGGAWEPVSQDYVDFDTPLLLGNYQTTARQLLAMVNNQPNLAADLTPEGAASDAKVEWDPDRGTFLRR